MSLELVNVPAANDACICWQIAAIALDEAAASEESVHFDVLFTCPNWRQACIAMCRFVVLGVSCVHVDPAEVNGLFDRF